MHMQLILLALLLFCVFCQANSNPELRSEVVLTQVNEYGQSSSENLFIELERQRALPIPRIQSQERLRPRFGASPSARRLVLYRQRGPHRYYINTINGLPLYTTEPRVLQEIFSESPQPIKMMSSNRSKTLKIHVLSPRNDYSFGAWEEMFTYQEECTEQEIAEFREDRKGFLQSLFSLGLDSQSRRELQELLDRGCDRESQDLVASIDVEFVMHRNPRNGRLENFDIQLNITSDSGFKKQVLVFNASETSSLISHLRTLREAHDVLQSLMNRTTSSSELIKIMNQLARM